MINFSCKKELSCESCRVANKPPIAIAGPDQTITLPTDSISLDGSASNDPDGTITAWSWKKISGPVTFSIINSGSAKTSVKNMVAGVYKFELSVTDNQDLSAKDTVTITVIQTTTQHVPCTDCKIAFVSDRDGNAEIYSCNADGTNIKRLTNSEGVDEQPAWSPDGKQIAFISDRSGVPEVYIMNADGSNVTRRTFTESYSASPSWSPDGTKIAFSMTTNDVTASDLWIVGATTGAPSLLFNAKSRDLSPAWSPDGTKIAFTSDNGSVNLEYALFTIKPDGTGFTKMPVINIYEESNLLTPSWSPDGSKLGMEIRQFSGINPLDIRFGVMNADGTGVKAVASGIQAWTTSSWSADGTKLAYTSVTGSRKDVSWASADGSSRGVIVTNGWNPNWQH
jgi:Tol biopolymer transport system component